MNNNLLTVFTPTYNRAHTLPVLYESLKRQSSKNFEWLIVDDGSTDNTEELIRSWIDEGTIAIRYEKQENGGKMKAHNRGAEMTDSELFVCIDSDDFLSDDAVSSIIEKWQDTHNKESLAGFIAYKAIKNQKCEYKVVCRFPYFRDAKLYLLYRDGFKGDTTIVFRTEVLKRFPFPIFEGEKFISETVMYNQMDLEYNWALLDKALTLCEYMPDGYTQNSKDLLNRNPKGMAFLSNQKAGMPGITTKSKIQETAKYIIYSKRAGSRKVYNEANVKGILYFAALFLVLRYEKLM